MNRSHHFHLRSRGILVLTAHESGTHLQLRSEGAGAAPGAAGGGERRRRPENIFFVYFYNIFISAVRLLCV